jgi:hypothetical protein
MSNQDIKSVTVRPETVHSETVGSASTNPGIAVLAPEAIEHQNVPQEHRGLHDFLYSSTDEHGAEVTPEVATVAATVTADANTTIEDWCNAAQNAKVAGVYAVLNSSQQTQYIGYSRNVSLSLRSHLTAHEAEVCAFVRVQPFKFPKREEMEQLRDRWIAELPSPPPGNIDGSTDWASTVRDAAAQVMSEADRAIYEEKKLKLRKAMADGSLHKEESAASQDLAAKIQDDNWSAVISEQTKETH